MIDVLRCPVCAASFVVAGGSLRCSAAHSFDVAKQGYVSLLDGRSGALRSDTAAMVAARDRVHQAGVFAPVLEATSAAAAQAITRSGGLIVDAGAGGGHYLRAAMAAADGHSVGVRGLGIDLSRHCARAQLRGHPALTAVVADIWRRLPVADDAASVVLSVFSPRNIAEFSRILRPGGVLILVRPLPGHLGELIRPMRMLSVDDTKAERIQAALRNHAVIVDEHDVSSTVAVSADVVADLAGMGPSAFHLEEDDIAELARRFAGDGAVEVTVSVAVTVCRAA